MRTIISRAICLLFVAALEGSCATVDQFGSRAYDGNLNTQNALNQEVLVNIIRASRYESLMWNPTSQIGGGQMQSLTTGLPNIGPFAGPALITNSLSSGVNGSYSTAPLQTASFQAGMLTPVDLKTIASLQTYYPREAIFYALIGAINLKTVSSHPQFARLVNDPSQAYYNIDHPDTLDQLRCYNEIVTGSDSFARLFLRDPQDRGHRCSYAKFLNLLGLLIEYGLYTELVQIPAPAGAQAQANQGNIITLGRFCFDKRYTPGFALTGVDLPACELDKKQNLGGTVVVTETVTHKADDLPIATDTKSAARQIVTTKTSILPISGHNFRFDFKGIGPVEVSFELRSPNGFLNYLGSWYNAGDRIEFKRYDRDNPEGILKYNSPPAKQIFKDGPYLSIINRPFAPCYTSVNYEGQTYCVPADATHTKMLMDIAVILRNLSTSPTDLNAPVTVRVAE